MNTKHILIGIVLGFALVLALGIGKQSSIESEPASKATAVEVQSDEEPLRIRQLSTQHRLPKLKAVR